MGLILATGLGKALAGNGSAEWVGMSELSWAQALRASEVGGDQGHQVARPALLHSVC